jgi:hypothetical protein
MKLSWLFNGTMEARHLAAAYLIVWVLQGGYALYVLSGLSRLRLSASPENRLPRS